MLRAFRFGEIYFPAGGRSEIGEFEALTSLLCCNPLKNYCNMVLIMVMGRVDSYLVFNHTSDLQKHRIQNWW